MNSYLLTIFIIFLLNNKIITTSSNLYEPSSNQTSLCLIRNVEYKDEYLYSSDRPDIYDSFKHRVYTNQNDYNYISSNLQMGWLLIPSNYLANTFYIQSIRFPNEYLCTSHLHFDPFFQRRKVNLNKLNQESVMTNKKCLWKLELIKGEKFDKTFKQYRIWNVNYKEAMYAGSDMLKTARTNRRNIFTWYSRPDSNQFIWDFICFK